MQIVSQSNTDIAYRREARTEGEREYERQRTCIRKRQEKESEKSGESREDVKVEGTRESSSTFFSG